MECYLFRFGSCDMYSSARISVSSSHAKIFGVRISSMREHDVANVLVEEVSAGRGGHIVTVNVDILRQCVGDPAFAGLSRSIKLQRT